MILLDRNVVSGLMRATPDPALVRWLDGQARTSIWITSTRNVRHFAHLGTPPVDPWQA